MKFSNSDQHRTNDSVSQSPEFPVIHRELPGLATVAELAERLEISRSTAYRWINENKLLAWESRRKIKGPIDQVLGPGQPLPRLAELAAEMNLPPELIWDFVSNPWRWSGLMESPLEKLRRGEVEDVLNAAPSYMTAMG